MMVMTMVDDGDSALNSCDFMLSWHLPHVQSLGF
jgi:hypothetical protein